MTDHLDYDRLRADTVRQVAKLMAAAAITAPKSGGNPQQARRMDAGPRQGTPRSDLVPRR